MRLLHLAVVLSVASASPAVLQSPQDEEKVQEIWRLVGGEGPHVFQLLLSKLSDEHSSSCVTDAAVLVISSFKRPEQQEQVLDCLQSQLPGRVLVLLLDAVRRGGWSVPMGRIAARLSSASPEVCWRALALVHEAGDETQSRIAELCSAPNSLVRAHALDALVRCRSSQMGGLGAARLADPARVVRLAALQAVRAARHQAAVDPLIHRLREERGALVTQIASTLTFLTGRDLGLNASAWEDWRAGRPDSTAGRAAAAYPCLFFGVPTASRRIVFVIDCSTSMECLVTDTRRFGSLAPEERSRMAAIKAGLLKAIEDMSPEVRFNLIAFESTSHPWQNRLQPATPEIKSAARAWIEGLHPVQDERWGGGLAPPDVKGLSNTFDALSLALGPVPNGLESEDDVDTVFLVTDSLPTRGSFVDIDDVLHEIVFLNEPRRITLHTLAIGTVPNDFLRQLAERNGPGTFVDLDR